MSFKGRMEREREDYVLILDSVSLIVYAIRITINKIYFDLGSRWKNLLIDYVCMYTLKLTYDLFEE